MYVVGIWGVIYYAIIAVLLNERYSNIGRRRGCGGGELAEGRG